MKPNLYYLIRGVGAVVLEFLKFDDIFKIS